jgi:DnaJ-class molecular chaperone
MPILSKRDCPKCDGTGLIHRMAQKPNICIRCHGSGKCVPTQEEAAIANALPVYRYRCDCGRGQWCDCVGVSILFAGVPLRL